MAWIARSLNNALFIYEDKPERRESMGVFASGSFGFKCDYVELPSDADEKLIGRHISWDDDPVKIE